MFKWLAVILGVVFIVMKLTGLGEVATWSWWAVTSPIWGYMLFVMLVVLLVGISASIKA